jgi:pimeloyl-ACP methyl ester carboxylesterase
MLEHLKTRRLPGLPFRRVILRTPQIRLSAFTNKSVAEPVRGLILALHGGGYSAGYWNCPVRGTSFFTLAAKLGFHVVAPDRPGYGSSRDFNPARLGLDNQVEFLFDALEDWSSSNAFSGPAFVIGHSLGGIIALLMAAHPRAQHLCAVDVLGVPIHYRASSAGEIVKSLPQAGTHVPSVDDHTRRLLMFGPEDSYESLADRHDAAAVRPMPVAEYREAIAIPESWPTVLPRIRIPVQFTAAELELMQATGNEVLDEVRTLLSSCPHKSVHLQRRSGHNASTHKIAAAYHLRAIAFFEECIALQK